MTPYQQAVRDRWSVTPTPTSSAITWQVVREVG